MKLYQSKNKIVVKNDNGYVTTRTNGHYTKFVVYRNGCFVFQGDSIRTFYAKMRRKMFKNIARQLAKQYLSHEGRLVALRQVYYRLNDDCTEDKIQHAEYFIMSKNAKLPEAYWVNDNTLITYHEV